MTIITDSSELRKQIDKLVKEEFVTIDTEFLREKTYYPELCLVQVGGTRRAFAIDPLADGIDLTPLKELLENPNIVKVFHACQQDVEIFLHDMDVMPDPIFDTQVAAQVLGYGDSIGYGNLVDKICGKKLDKSSRFTDWSKRPLSKKQLDYAISDVTHLRKIYKHLIKELTKKDRMAWVEEEMEALHDPSKYEIDPEEAWQMLRLKTGNKQFLSLVKALSTWREERAQKLNKPRQWILKSDGIMEIASADPREPEDLEDLRFFNVKKPELVDEILEVVKKGRKLRPPKLEKKRGLPRGSGPLMDLLRVLLKMQCDMHDVSPSIVANAEDLEQIAVQRNPAKDKSISAMHGWRYEVFGKYALALKKGELALAAEGRKMVLIEPVYG